MTDEIKSGDMVYVGGIDYAEVREIEAISSVIDLQDSLCVMKYFVVAVEKSSSGGEDTIFGVLVHDNMEQDVHVEDYVEDDDAKRPWSQIAEEGRLTIPLIAVSVGRASKSAKVAIEIEMNRLYRRVKFLNSRLDSAAKLLSKLHPCN